MFHEIICLNNLFLAWKEFVRGKRNKPDIQKFEFNLEDNIFKLYQELTSKTYQHSDYKAFYVQDPKLRCIHKACVKDRVLHHAMFRTLYPIFDKSFIFDSYSCRLERGTHRAVNRLQVFARKANKNNTKTCFILKCDIKKFFDSIDQVILLNFIKKKIRDKKAIWLIKEIISSFQTGLPLGNITSQLFANIYLNKLDQFIKHKLRIKYYLRYCDDFVILSQDKYFLENLIPQIDKFLKINLKLFLHPNKIIIRRYQQGIDFLGYVSFPHHRILRTKTKKRMFKKLGTRIKDLRQGQISGASFNQTIQSYLGLLKHCNSHKIILELNKIIKTKTR